MANPVLIPVLRSRIGGAVLGRWLAVIDYTGRRSGLAHRLVTQYEADGPTVTIRVGMADRKTWWRNFRAPQPVQIRLAGQEHGGIAHSVIDDAVRVVVDLTTDATDAAPAAPEERR